MWGHCLNSSKLCLKGMMVTFLLGMLFMFYKVSKNRI